MDATIIVAIVGLCFQYGVPAVTEALARWNKPVVTMEDVTELKGMIKRPEEY
jgi:hypothetical protein